MNPAETGARLGAFGGLRARIEGYFHEQRLEGVRQRVEARKGSKDVQNVQNNTLYDGGQYSGDMEDGKRHGRGKYTYPDGSPDGVSYDGEWKEDKKHGAGVFIYSDGSCYEGEWNEDKKAGTGKLTDSHGSRYEGEWNEDGKMHGKGIQISKSGLRLRHEGVWKDGKKHGKFVLISDGKRTYQEWEDDKRIMQP